MLRGLQTPGKLVLLLDFEEREDALERERARAAQEKRVLEEKSPPVRAPA